MVKGVEGQAYVRPLGASGPTFGLTAGVILERASTAPARWGLVDAREVDLWRS